ncbi:UNVERIFIED_CONTAM: hypothetical protein GTU68_028229 [Idotea baltica]|nr:hypothetical protein [Idotea baltica]
MDQSICELESDKATLELPAEQAGIVTFVASEGDDLAIGDVVCKLEPAAKPAAAKSEPAAKVEEVVQQVAPVASANSKDSYAKGHASPSAKKMMDEAGIDNVNGTGKDGRILKSDNVRREKMSRLRRTIASHLVNAKNTTAMLTTFNEVDLTEVKAIRAKYKESFKEKYGVGLGFMGFFTKACCLALQEFEAVNAQMDGEEVVYHDFCDISIAVSTPKGLVTPVLRNAESLGLRGIEKGIKALALKGRDNKLSLEDIRGGTFTISNGGVFGSLQSTPIINAPQTAILGMHKIQDRPVAINGEVKIRPMMYLALSYDHRIIDGKEAVSFLVKVKDYLEDPVRLMLNV